MNSTLKQIRMYRAMGLTVTYTGKTHLRLSHPTLKVPIIVSGSPSDWRAEHKVRSMLKRKGILR